jgi:hypothetical protein
MSVISYTQMPTYEPAGQDLGVYWNEQFIEPEGEQSHWVYDYCLAKTTDNYAALVSKLIRSKYSQDAELAAINSLGVDYYRFLQFREVAKNLARGWLGMEQKPIPRWQLASIVMDRLTDTEREGLMASEVWQVRWLVNKTLANQAISEADPDFAMAVMMLDQLGIVAEGRWDELLSGG